MFKEYYRLAKPGIVYGNLLTTLAAYLYISRWDLVTPAIWINFLATMIGLGLVIASACVFNNYIDRDIDKKMKRTKNRALATGAIPNEKALLFGSILWLIGITLLVAFVNFLTAFVALVGFVVYVFAYTFSKRVTRWSTEIGSVSGAAPIVVGYTAFAGHFDWIALILFLILVFWQMPHFFAISIFRTEDYALANLPVLPLKKGTRETKILTLVYMIAFALAVFALTWFHFAGYWYLVIVELASLIWYWHASRGFWAENEAAWARRLFFLSLTVLVIFCVMLSVAAILP